MQDQTIESVEEQVERLLEADMAAASVEYGVYGRAFNPSN
jgi:TATA-binding protein-associated factor Taf7